MKKITLFAAAMLCGALMVTAQNTESGHEWVDLGLPSGLKWATCNVGATAPEASGNYYAWGETAAKDTYTWDNYKYGTAGNCTEYTYADGKTVLDIKDDAAAQNWGGAWRMPTEAEWTELCEQCEWTWAARNDIFGYEAKSKINGNSIFLPAASWYDDNGKQTGNSNFSYWSSSRNDENNAWGRIRPQMYEFERYNGLPVRPVAAVYMVTVNAAENGTVNADKSVALENDEITLTVTPNEGCELDHLVVKQGETEVTVSNGKFTMPAGDVIVNATFKKIDYTVTVNASENGTVEPDRTTAQMGDEVTLTVTPDEGFVLAQLVVKQGETEIVVSNGKFTMPAGDVTVSSTFMQPEWVDLGLPSGLKWATMNVGATAPEGYGNYYLWGETETQNDYSWFTYKYANGAEDKLTKYCTDASYGDNGFIDNKTVLEPEDDAATVNWGDEWRMPTDAEWTELREQCTWTWTTQNDINGCQVTSKTNSNSIFLPAAASRYDTYLSSYAGRLGNYWSSSLNKDNPSNVWGVYFNYSGAVDRNGYARRYGFSVRPVQEGSTSTALQPAESVAIQAENGRVVCDGDFRIYDLLGRDVTKMNGSLNGVYVVKTADAAQKVVVK